MAKHHRFTSHDAVTGTGPGVAQKTRGHQQHGLWVEAEGIDPANDTLEIRLEVSPDDVHYAQIDSGAPAVEDVIFLDQTDLEESDDTAGVYVGYIQGHNIPVEYVRANIASNSAGATVTTYVFLCGWTGRGKSFDDREDTPTGQLGR